MAALGKSGRRTQAQAELLALTGEMPEDEASKERIGKLLLEYGMPKESAATYKKVIQQNPRNGDAYAGLGEAACATGDYRSAEEAFKSALHWKPDDVSIQKRLQKVEQILSLDPNLGGLRAADRYQRSRKLLEAVLGAMDQCLATATGTPPDAVTETTDSARKSLLYRGRPRSYSDATEANLALCEQLWKVRVDSCGPPKASDEILKTLMARLSR